MRLLRLTSLVGLIAFFIFNSNAWAHPEGPHTQEQFVEHMNESLHSSPTKNHAVPKQAITSNEKTRHPNVLEQILSKIF